MIERDANGNIPRKDERCRIYRVAGLTNGKAWEGFNQWTVGVFPSQAEIEAYPTFKGWVTGEILGTDRRIAGAGRRSAPTYAGPGAYSRRSDGRRLRSLLRDLVQCPARDAGPDGTATIVFALGERHVDLPRAGTIAGLVGRNTGGFTNPNPKGFRGT